MLRSACTTKLLVESTRLATCSSAAIVTKKLEIHYGEDGLEIGGVHGSIEDWREILLPLLLIEEKNGRLIEHKPTSAKDVPTTT